MGLCASKKQTNFVSPVKQINLYARHTIGANSSVGIPAMNLANGQLQKETFILQNLEIDFQIMKNHTQHQDNTDRLIEEIQNDYPDLYNLTLFDYEYGAITVTGKVYSKNNCYIRVQRKSFKKFQDMSYLVSKILRLKRLEIEGVQSYDDMKIRQNGSLYVVDRFFNDPVESLNKLMKEYWNYTDFTLILQILQSVGKKLHKLHEADFNYKNLRPSSIYVINGEIKKANIQLQSPNYQWHKEEISFLQNFLDSEQDFQKYDSLCLTFLFVTLIDPKTDSKAVRVYYMSQISSKSIFMKCEVDFFKSLRGVDIDNPFDEKQMEGGKEKGFEQVQGGEWKQYVQIFEGPNNYQYRSRGIFYFYDTHNKYKYLIFQYQNRHFYSIPDNTNIFENGIRYGFVDMSVTKGDFKEAILRFACGSPEIFEEFSKISFKIAQVEWATELQHGVFLIYASKNIFVLDFNFKCFYSFASLYQLQCYERNNINDPTAYQNAFEIRNQPFDIKFPFINSLGRNVIFQDGLLHMMGRKEIETVLCSYELIPEQSSIVLQSCISLNSGIDILKNLPFKLNYQSMSSLKIKTDDIFIRQPLIIGSYTVIKVVNEKENLKILKVVDHFNRNFLIRQSILNNFEEFYYIMDLFAKKLSTKYLIDCADCFMTKDKQDNLYINIVEEFQESTLEDEIIIRRKNKAYFEPKELAYLLRIIFKAVISMTQNNISHGNIIPLQIFFLQNGLTKIAGWQLQNQRNWKNDFIDACAVINNCILLELDDYAHQFSLQKLQEFASFYDKYPGVYQFLQKVLQDATKNPGKMDYIQLKSEVKKIYRILQKESLDINRINSRKNNVFWIGYGNCFIISANYHQNSFCKSIIKLQDGSLYKFSKYSMFTFDGERTMYISGAIKEDLKKQNFYSLDFQQFGHNEELKLQKLQDIPGNLLNPTLLFCENQVYSFGGYELSETGSKYISKACYSYNIKKKNWKILTELPVNLVNSTALQSTKDKDIIYLFGGISSEIDLTGRELNFFIYSISKNIWEFKVNLELKSPFQNSRFVKPIIQIIQDDIFLSFQKISGIKQGYFFEFFELQRGGINLKFSYNEKIDPILAEEREELNIFTDHNPKTEYSKTQQDDLSMIIKKNIIYNLDEIDKSLVKLNYTDSIEEVTLDRIPCSIVGDEMMMINDDGNYEEKDSFNSYHHK